MGGAGAGGDTGMLYCMLPNDAAPTSADHNHDEACHASPLGGPVANLHLAAPLRRPQGSTLTLRRRRTQAPQARIQSQKPRRDGVCDAEMGGEGFRHICRVRCPERQAGRMEA